MLNVNKETMLMVAVVVALLATFYMYKELQKTKQDVQGLATNGQKLDSQFSELTHALANDANKREEEDETEDKK